MINCEPITSLAQAGVRMVAARSMGRGALSRCHEAGIKIYQTQADSVLGLLDEISNDKLIDFPDAALCSHGSGHHAHHHEEDSDHE